MASKADVACLNCGAENPFDYEFCFACRVPSGTVNVHEADEHGNHVATGEVLEGAKAKHHAATNAHRAAMAIPADAERPAKKDPPAHAAPAKKKSAAKSKAKKKATAA